MTGISPERALTRLARRGIAVYDSKKVDSTTLHFSIDKKEEERALALYPIAGRGASGVYTLKRLPERGISRIFSSLKRKVGLLLGGLLFVAVTAWGDTLVLRIAIDAPAVYIAQVQDILQEGGVQRYLPYQKDKEDLICAKLLALEGVSYCAIQKQGAVLTVSLKTNAFFHPDAKRELLAERSGVVKRLVVLQGTANAQVGDSVPVGARLVEGAIYSPEGARQECAVCAYVSLLCEYVAEYVVDDPNEAFAAAYLGAGLDSEQGELQSQRIEKQGEKYVVSLSYLWTQRLRI